MKETTLLNKLLSLQQELKGDISIDDSTRLMYATDASAYREKPLAVIRPKHRQDIIKIIDFARAHHTSLIPRGAGTSLAGQVVGGGIIVDTSRYMNNILEVHAKECWVRVEPGVILDELNKHLEPLGLFFSPETSTGNRCTIGGMLGNNACGSHSILYGSTRDHTLEVKALLSDNSEVVFKDLTRAEFHQKCHLSTLEGRLYQQIHSLLSQEENRKRIQQEYPDPEIKRRNTGYAIDLLLNTQPFYRNDTPFNFTQLLAGSEGTLAFVTEITLRLVPLPPKEKGLICAHFHTLEEAFKANLVALQFLPGAVELIDDKILKLTEGNIEQKKNRFFIKGQPGAILIIEFARETMEEIDELSSQLEIAMKNAGYGYHFPMIRGNDMNKVWGLRKAGLGLLSNMKGDAKPVSLIEDTAVHVNVLPRYLEEFRQMLKKYEKECVYHAHIGSGELHLRPVLNLKDKEDIRLFRILGEETAWLVKKYRGSLSGEHGDGRLRGEFIPIVIGEQNYQLLKQIKETWDPQHIFNPGKIIDTPPMNTHLRYEPGQQTREIETIFDFSDVGGIARLAEKCNGSGDCRKSAIIGGTMCPSYMATLDENTTTRARANILREFLTRSPKKGPFDHEEIYRVLDLCLSCKGCKSECPSSVDMAKMKAEFLQHYYDKHGIPLRTRVIAYIPFLNKLGSMLPSLYNTLISKKIFIDPVKKALGFARLRSIPVIHKRTLIRWSKKYLATLDFKSPKKVFLFIDEFTNYNDTEIGIKAIKLLTQLGYQVLIPRHTLSGRTFISKGLLRKARSIAIQNVTLLKDIVTENTPLIGIEPSAILGFRDEFPDLVGEKLKEESMTLAKNTFLIDEFIAAEIKKGNISQTQFSAVKKKILLHGHCQQKAVASTLFTKEILSFPKHYEVEEIPSGCCGMAGSFGYEKEHYAISMKVGELVLFPAVRNATDDTLIVAPGTSCRHQIKDGTGKKALHPIEVLYEALV